MEIVNGYRVHRWSESNGMDYDRCSAPCQNQTKKGMEAFRQQSAAHVEQRIVEVKGKLAVLEANLDRIKRADHPNNIHIAVERVNNL